MTVKDKCMIKFYKNGESLYMHFEQRLVTECLLLYIKKLTLVKSIFNTRGTEGLGLAVGGACLLLLLLGSSPHVHACHPRGALHVHWVCRVFSGPWD